MSQVQAFGGPLPVTWDDYERGCILTYGGGYREPETILVFRHGMNTVFNLLRREFPPAEQCKAAPELLAACQQALDEITVLVPGRAADPILRVLEAAIAKAKGGPS